MCDSHKTWLSHSMAVVKLQKLLSSAKRCVFECRNSNEYNETIYFVCVCIILARRGCMYVCVSAYIILNICKCMRIYMYEIYIRDATIPSMDKITEVNYLRMDYTDGLSYTGYDNKIILCMHCFPLHSPLLRESWLVSIIALR